MSRSDGTPSLIVFTAIAGFVLFVFALPASATVQMEFPNHATIKEHIPVMAYDFKNAPPLARVCTGSGGSGSVTITKSVDASSPKLADAAKEKGGATVIVDDQQANGRHMAFQFIGATISTIATMANDPQMEKVSFNYSRIQWVTVGCAPPKAPPTDVRNGVYGGGGMGNGGMGRP